MDSTGLRVLAIVTVIAGLGSAVMAIAHAGVQVPVVSALGPGSGAAVPPAAAGFAAGAALYLLMAGGVARARPWSWALGLVLNTLVLVTAAMPFRGAGSVAGIAISLAGLALLLTPGVRRALLTRAGA